MEKIIKKYMLLILLAVGQLSAETTVIGKEPIKQAFSRKQKIIISSVMLASHIATAIILAKTMADLFFKKASIGNKALHFTAALGASVALSLLEDKFFEKYPNFFETCKETALEQNTIEKT
jgi:hypothetical protein